MNRIESMNCYYLRLAIPRKEYFIRSQPLILLLSVLVVTTFFIRFVKYFCVTQHFLKILLLVRCRQIVSGASNLFGNMASV